MRLPSFIFRFGYCCMKGSYCFGQGELKGTALPRFGFEVQINDNDSAGGSGPFSSQVNKAALFRDSGFLLRFRIRSRERFATQVARKLRRLPSTLILCADSAKGDERIVQYILSSAHII